ncbi:hypothetical protein [Sulfitobacter sp.]|uniref:hypothetical protein n=1 Tax=Sulfitobacter sp. TaxID=1903071 RepID=UPI003002AABD
MTILSPGHIRLSGERKAQLEEIAELTGAASLSAAIGELIKFARTQGLVDHTIPGVQIRAASDGLLICFDGKAQTPLTHEGVAALTATIREFVDGKESPGAFGYVDHNYSVSRRGTSLKVAIPSGEATTKTWASDIASDFADLIEAESAKARAA